MTSAIRLFFGFSALALAVGSVGCSSSGGNAGTGGAIAVGGSGNSGGATSGGGSGGAAPGGGVPLTPVAGWVDGASNALGIQGAYFTYADDTTLATLVSDTMTGDKICIKGTAAKVLKAPECMIKAPATDCFGTYWGAAIGFNLNQPNVANPDGGGMMGGDPVPFDATAIKGFSFDVGAGTDGVSMLPPPAQFRFNIEDATTQYCTATAKGIKAGTNSYTFADVFSKCYASPPGPSAETIHNGVVKISWQVATVEASATPFDFCISNVRATQ